MARVLLLGGTTEASTLARKLATMGVDAVYSYAGRTDAPVAQPLPTRVGGFGGPDGLAAYLLAEQITHVVDATHPFAAGMSVNAITACTATATPLCAYERAPWEAVEGDDWSFVPDIAGAVAALPEEPTKVFLAIGRQHLAAFAVKPWHQYMVRLVDTPTTKLPLAGAEVIVARGPFSEEDDLRLLKSRRVNLIVAKNSGGSGARAKLVAARRLRLPVILIERPRVSPRLIFRKSSEVLRWLDHDADLGV